MYLIALRVACLPMLLQKNLEKIDLMLISLFCIAAQRIRRL